MQIPSEFQVIRSLGLGATSEVFEAVKVDTQESIALKVFSPLILSDADACQRLRGEVDALEKLQHANIVALKRTFARPDFFALELELVRGVDLRQWAIGFDSALHEPKLWILAQVARGLGAAHENGVLHRDLKPENILVSNAGDVKLTDFGLSRSISRLTLTRMGFLVGSLGYMAPECVNGLRATEQSDLFSFGVIAYELLSGVAPFEAETPQALIKKITDGTFVSLKTLCPSIPTTVADEIDRCLALHPSNRPESSWSVEAVLMNCLLASGLVSNCRALVSVVTRESALSGALAAKHLRLSERVKEAMTLSAESDGADTRRKLLPAVNELKRIFPDDPLIARSLALMTGGSVTSALYRPSRRGAVVAITLLIVMLIVWFGDREFKHSAPTAPVQASFAPSLVQASSSASSTSGAFKALKAEATPTPRPMKRPRAVAAIAPKTPLQKAGALVFQADPDVDIYVDGKLVSPTAWDNYETAIGERKIRLVKAGFDPIENIVSVKDGQKTVVKAKQ